MPSNGGGFSIKVVLQYNHSTFDYNKSSAVSWTVYTHRGKLGFSVRDKGVRRLATPNERDRINPGLAAGFSGKDNKPAVRNVANGNAMSADMLKTCYELAHTLEDQF